MLIDIIMQEVYHLAIGIVLARGNCAQKDTGVSISARIMPSGSMQRVCQVTSNTPHPTPTNTNPHNQRRLTLLSASFIYETFKYLATV